MYKNLKALRKSLGMTQEEMGKSLGIPKNTYYNYETQTNEPRSDFWAKVSEKYGVSIDYLMDLTDDPRTYEQKQKDAETMQSERVTADEVKLLEVFRRVPEQDKAMLLEMINVTLKNRGLLQEDI